MASAPPPQAFGTMGPPPGFHFPTNHGHHTAAPMPSGRTPGRARRRLAPTALTGPGVGVGMGVQPPMVPLPTPLVNPGTTFAAAALHGGPPTFHSRGPNRGRSSSHASHSSAHSSGSGSGSHFVIAPPATPPQYHGGTRSHGRQATSTTGAAAAAAGNIDGRSHRSNSSDSNVSMSSASRRTSGTSYAAAAAGAAASTAATAVSSPVPTTARGSSANAEVGKASPGGLRAKRDGEISIFVGNVRVDAALGPLLDTASPLLCRIVLCCVPCCVAWCVLCAVCCVVWCVACRVVLWCGVVCCVVCRVLDCVVCCVVCTAAVERDANRVGGAVR